MEILHENLLADEARPLFASLGVTENGNVFLKSILRRMEVMGIMQDDPRLQSVFDDYKNYSGIEDVEIEFDEFVSLFQNGGAALIKNALRGNLVLPQFQEFTKDVEQIFQRVRNVRKGKVATYIPQLGRINPELFAVSITTIDGQRLNLGDSQQNFCIQSVCKPINYCLALEEHGVDKVHQHIGREPSGASFNSLSLNANGLPHNPMINAGAIMSSSLIKAHLPMADRFDFILDCWKGLSGNKPVHFNNSVYLSERETADRNFALGHFMKEKNAFPKNTNLLQTLELYFQCCSIEVTSEQLSVVASTLANGGINPLTGRQMFAPDTVKNCLSLMSSCGMYDFSGEFAFMIGIPAKSGVGGGIMAVIPNVMGIAIYSPRLDAIGNSARGIEFFKQFVQTFNFHSYDSLVSGYHQKKDPRINKLQSKLDGVMSLCWAASEGDIAQIQKLIAQGVNVNDADYDGRTALHLAASEGHLKTIRFLLHQKAKPDVKDRWGNTPADDAIRTGNHQAIEILTSNSNII